MTLRMPLLLPCPQCRFTVLASGDADDLVRLVEEKNELQRRVVELERELEAERDQTTAGTRDRS